MDKIEIPVAEETVTINLTTYNELKANIHILTIKKKEAESDLRRIANAKLVKYCEEKQLAYPHMKSISIHFEPTKEEKS